MAKYLAFNNIFHIFAKNYCLWNKTDKRHIDKEALALYSCFRKSPNLMKQSRVEVNAHAPKGVGFYSYMTA